MVKTRKHNLNLEKFPLSLSELGEKEIKKLSEISVLEFKINDYSDCLFEKLLKNLMNTIIKTHKLYFIYFESLPQKKTQIRSFKKIFRSHKSKLGKVNLFELEVDIEPNKSIISALVKIDKNNIDYCIDELINSNFSFGYATLKDKRSFPVNKTEFINKHILNKLEGRKLFKVNLLKSISQNLNANKIIFDLKISGRDEEIIEIFFKDKIIEGISQVEKEFKSIVEN